MNNLPRCVPRSPDPLDQELAARLNAWALDGAADSRQSLRVVMIELAAWIAAAVLVAVATVVWYL
ncbi:MAG: hypothetical protein AB7U18_20255 [Dehalococcoidia bacterium]